MFDVGSITKPLTLAAALALVEDARLDLSDRLGDLLPGVPADKQAITLRQLLEHRAGLPEYVVDVPGGDFVELSRNEALSSILSRPLRFEPGSDYGYSDVANDYGFNSAVVEGDRARDAIVVLTNADANRAERLARRIAPLVFRQLAR